jgi:hypothetical protein
MRTGEVGRFPEKPFRTGLVRTGEIAHGVLGKGVIPLSSYNRSLTDLAASPGVNVIIAVREVNTRTLFNVSGTILNTIQSRRAMERENSKVWLPRSSLEAYRSTKPLETSAVTAFASVMTYALQYAPGSRREPQLAKTAEYASGLFALVAAYELGRHFYRKTRR